MKIDEGAFEEAAYRNGLPSAAEETRLRGFLGRYLAALPALPSAEPGRDRIEPPDGKLRVRVAVAVSPGGIWSAAGADDLDDELAALKARPFNTFRPHSIRWIEADVTPWQPPAEETVQGREVAG